MQVDLSLSNAKVYDIEKVDIVKGQKFSLLTDYTEPSRWFFDQDQVLNVTQEANSADVEATEIGTSTIIIVGATDFTVLKQITIKVVAEIIEPVADLGTKAGEAVLKP